MKKNALCLLLILVAGQAYARLGETIEEIEKRVGKLELSEESGYLSGTANEAAGFTRTKFTFYKKELWGQKTNKCIQVEYFADYRETPHDQRYSISDAKELVKRNYPNVEMTLWSADKVNLEAPRPPPGCSLRIWQGMGENGGVACLILYADNITPSFKLTCRSNEIQKDGYEKQEREKKQTYQKL